MRTLLTTLLTLLSVSALAGEPEYSILESNSNTEKTLRVLTPRGEIVVTTAARLEVGKVYDFSVRHLPKGQTRNEAIVNLSWLRSTDLWMAGSLIINASSYSTKIGISCVMEEVEEKLIPVAKLTFKLDEMRDECVEKPEGMTFEHRSSFTDILFSSHLIKLN